MGRIWEILRVRGERVLKFNQVGSGKEQGVENYDCWMVVVVGNGGFCIYR